MNLKETLLHKEIWFASARTLLKLLSHCTCTANSVWQYESQKGESFEPAYLSCQIAHLDWVERALSLLTHGMTYGQIKCFLLDLLQRSSVCRAPCSSVSVLNASLPSQRLLVTQPHLLWEVLLKATPCLFICFRNLGTRDHENYHLM